ncbi:MAG: amidohydrolase family protein [Acidobacteriia bacterium]|nr:amidohydrolase family protein [Terriglobia bacterium]
MANLTKRCTTLLAGMALIAAVFSLSAADNRAYVIQNAKVFTLSSAGTLEKASVLVVDGKIAAVGKTIKVPAGAQIIKGEGLEVYPGMVNAWGNIGLTEIGSVDVMNDSADLGNFKPQLLAFSAVHPASEMIPVARVNGITAAISAPSGGMIAGQAALLHLDGWTADEMAVLKSAGMVLALPSSGGGRGGRGGAPGTPPTGEAARGSQQQQQINELSELLEKARHYAKARETNPATERDRQLDALIPVVSGKMTVFMQAQTARDIRNAVEFARKEKLKFVIQGGREVNKVADLLKKENVPVILDSIVALPTRQDDPYDARFTLPKELAAAGVKFALTSPSAADVRNLPYEAGFAQAYGLSHEEALKAVILNPAEILGVADKIGTIEPGKIADLVVTDGDLLEIRTQVKNLFISGRDISLETKHTLLYKKYMERK